jgi:tRNA A-37 threonylcarbamoyl transferase component Bud32
VSTAQSFERTTGFARWVAQLPLRLSRRLWLFPLLGGVVLGAVGWWVHAEVEGGTREEMANRLQTLLNADVAALRLWFSEQEGDARALAGDSRIRDAIIEVADLARDPVMTQARLANSAPAKSLQFYVTPLIEAQNYLDYVVVGTNRHILASTYRVQVGRLAPGGYDLFLQRALAGRCSISRPFARELDQNAEGPTMFVAAPVRSADGSVVAVLGLRMKPEAEFSRIFSVARMGETGEAYAFDQRGVMLTASRFDGDLKRLGLIPNTDTATAILNVRLTDPGVDLEELRRRRLRRDAPLTRMAAAATKGRDDCDVNGYRNYRGAKVVGAWSWLPDYGMGVATEVSAEEAFRNLYVLRKAFFVLFSLVALSGVAIFVFTLLVDRLEASVRKSALAVRRLGQYALLQEIGRGANGMVYRARHALLRRPVAIKLLDPELTDEANAARFEHEVQMTSQLTHPNTVAIYDYGRTPEGLFYYAMEYLSGIDLDQLVRDFGPQPEGRVIHILRQVCGSLAEAHRVGLIHRDIKPANIVLTRRGGLCDVVKVLDFGLVKVMPRQAAADAGKEAVVGTPHFMSPESIATPGLVDARSDLYSVAAVGYWLLTAKTLFIESQINILLDHQVSSVAAPPSARLGRQVSADLEAVLMRCLAKASADRPANAEALDDALGRCASANGWAAADAANWWESHLADLGKHVAPSMAEKTLVIAPRT